MSAFVTLEEAEQERLKQALFIDLIGLAPEGADLIISTDSWSGLPGLLGQRLVEREDRWVVPLIPSTRAFLVQQALADNLQTMLVHFYIHVKDTGILTYYDAMCGIKLEQTFPDYQRIITEYASLGIIMT